MFVLIVATNFDSILYVTNCFDRGTVRYEVILDSFQIDNHIREVLYSIVHAHLP